VLDRPKTQVVSRKKLSFDDEVYDSPDSTFDTESFQSVSFIENVKKNLGQPNSPLDIFQKPSWSSPLSDREILFFSPDSKSNSHRSFGIPPIFEVSPNEENNGNGLPPLELDNKMECEEESKDSERSADIDVTRTRSVSIPNHKLFFGGSETNSPAFSALRISKSGKIKSDSITIQSVMTTRSNNDNGISRHESFETLKRLPVTCKNLKNPDLTGITPETLSNLIKNDQNLDFLIVDCRYDYEYQGGHIKGAINITSPELLEELFFTKRHLLADKAFLKEIRENFEAAISSEYFKSAQACPQEQAESSPENPLIVVFHCEFSQKRGPRTLRALRNLDRQMNARNFPNLFYPEVYILEGGYQNFVNQYPDLCEPKGRYIQMADKNYRSKYSVSREYELKFWKKKTSTADL